MAGLPCGAAVGPVQDGGPDRLRARRSAPQGLGPGELELLVLTDSSGATVPTDDGQPLRTGLLGFGREGGLSGWARPWARGLRQAQLMVSRHCLGSTGAWRCDEILQLDDIPVILVWLDGELSVPMQAVCDVLDGLQARGHRIVVLGGYEDRRRAVAPWADGFLRGFDGTSGRTALAALWSLHFAMAEGSNDAAGSSWSQVVPALGTADLPAVLVPLVWRSRPFEVRINPRARRVAGRAFQALLTPFGPLAGAPARVELAQELSDWLREGPCRRDLRVAHTEAVDAWVPPGARRGVGAAFLLLRMTAGALAVHPREDEDEIQHGTSPSLTAPPNTLPGALEVVCFDTPFLLPLPDSRPLL